MTDLTKIDKPFGLLDRETKLALFAAWLDGKVMEARESGEWFDCVDPFWFDRNVYRVRPAPLTPDSIDWSHVAPEWRFMARDRGGRAFLYTDDPYLSGDMWNVDGDITDAGTFASYRRGTVDWKDSLVVRP